MGNYGGPGQYSTKFHNYLCRPDWLGFRLLGDKCEVATDLRFFHKALYAEEPPTDQLQQDELTEMPEFYEAIRATFNTRADFFREHGWLSNMPEKGSGPEEKKFYGCSFLQRVGGKSWHSNWSNRNENMPFSRHPSEKNGRSTDIVLPQTEDGRDFQFVCRADMWNFIDYCNNPLLVFYDPVEKVVLTTDDG